MGKFVAANRVAATLLLVMVLVSGCTSARVTRFSGGVTHSELEHGKLALAAITSVGEGETPQAEALARKIESRFRKARPWLTLLPLSNVRTNFDAAEYQQQLQLMSEWEDWSSFWLADFNRLTNHVRFLLLAHLRTQVEVAEAHRGPDPVTILFDLLWATFVDRDSDDADDDWEEEEEEEEETENVFYRKRTLETRLGIFDLHTRRLVWFAECQSMARGEPIPAGSDTQQIGSIVAPSFNDLEAFDEALKAMTARLPK
jgi:hypothetical protein